MDKNLVIVTGTLASATERTVGQQGRTLTELRLAVARPGRKGEGEQTDTVPVTIWNDDVGTAVLTLPVGTALTVVGKLTSREWNTRLYLELLADHVAAAVVTPGEGREPMPTARPSTAPARPSGERSTAREKSDVPF